MHSECAETERHLRVDFEQRLKAAETGRASAIAVLEDKLAAESAAHAKAAQEVERIRSGPCLLLFSPSLFIAV